MTGTEVGQAEGWACGGSHALVVALSAPRLTQSWPVPSPHRGRALGSSESRGRGCASFLLVMHANQVDDEITTTTKGNSREATKATSAKGKEARWV